MTTQTRDLPQGPSLTGRFALAVALTIGFYALALGIAGLLIGLPVWAYVVEDRIFNIWLELFMIVTGLGILRAIMPRRVPFVADGVRVEPGHHPRLQRAIDGVARQVGDSPPDDVYLTLDVNAAVTQTGGALGSGGRRVLFLGLPLMRVLTEAELRGVIAHEYGHYVGGDTKLGAWTFRTRLAVQRTIDRLSPEDPSWGQRLVRLPFIWYAKAFLRITSAISRRQEFAADALASRVAGRAAHRSGLVKIHRTAPAYDAYFDQELVPVLQSGFRPPVSDGFGRFLGTDGVREATERILAEQLEEERADPYSSHPTLPQRLAFVDSLSGSDDRSDHSGPAVGLIDGLDELEGRLLAELASGPPPELEPVPWEQVPDRVFLRDYRGLAGDYAGALEGHTVGAPPATEAALRDVAEAARRENPELAEDQAPALAFNLVGAALAVALVEAGWELTGDPGHPVACRRGDAEVRPFTVVGEIHDGERTAEAWREEAERLGIASLALRPARPAAAAEPAEPAERATA